MRALSKALRRLIRDESGQSLVVVVSAMSVLVGVAAFGLDAASWMVKHHQAQVAADAAAMAAAHCLADPGQAAAAWSSTACTRPCPPAPRAPTRPMPRPGGDRLRGRQRAQPHDQRGEREHNQRHRQGHRPGNHGRDVLRRVRNQLRPARASPRARAGRAARASAAVPEAAATSYSPTTATARTEQRGRPDSCRGTQPFRATSRATATSRQRKRNHLARRGRATAQRNGTCSGRKQLERPQPVDHAADPGLARTSLPDRLHQGLPGVWRQRRLPARPTAIPASAPTRGLLDHAERQRQR